MTTLFYAALLGLMSLVLGSIPGSMRGRKGIPIGDGGDQAMLLAIRRHANFVEQVPLPLILIFLLETNGVSNAAIHGLGAALLITRIVHAVGLKAETMSNAGRIIGAAGTALTTLVAAVWALVVYF